MVRVRVTVTVRVRHPMADFRYGGPLLWRTGIIDSIYSAGQVKNIISNISGYGSECAINSADFRHQ